MAPRIFKDEALQAKFEKQGFAIVQFLQQDEIEFLNKQFDELHPTVYSEGGFMSGSFSNDFSYKKTASDMIVSVFGKHFERLFTNYQTFGGAFLYKPPSKGSELGVHQDWTIVDEEKYVALNCWVPLTDINETNGALQILPGSQYSGYKTFRAPTLPFFFEGSEQEVIDRTIPFYVKAGEAVILNQSVIHYSSPNRSGKLRKAITAGVKTKDAPMIFHYQTPEHKIERFEMPEDFLIRFTNFATSIFERPSLGKLISSKDYQRPILDKSELIPVLNKLKSDAGFVSSSPSFFAKVFSKLKEAV